MASSSLRSSAQSDSSSPPPPWEVHVLVAHHLDPKTLATASCVCKSWFISMSSDYLWKPMFTARFPSLSNLAVSSTAASCIPFRRLFALSHAAATRRRPTPIKLLLSLSDLVFAISVSAHEDAQIIASCAKRGPELAADPNGLFKFDINLGGDCSSDVRAVDEVKVAWNVVLDGWRGVFTMMECGGKVGSAPRVLDGWFSEELPAAGCCSKAATGGIVADLKLGLCRSGGRNGDVEKMRIERVSVGILSIVNWRYISVEDGLRYLQHFLIR